MFTIEQTEEELYDRSKAWLKQHRRFILGGIGLLFGSVLVMQGWERYQTSQQLAASHAFTLFVQQESNKETQAAQATLESLKSDHQGTTYAAMASLLEAQLQVSTEALAEAKLELTWVKDHASAPWSELAVLRLARLAIQEQDTQTAQDLLGSLKGGVYATLARELEGDLALYGSNIALAKDAYQKAFESAPAPLGYRPFLRVKMEDLGLALPTAS